MVKRYLNGQHLDDVFAILDREFPRVLSTDIIPFDATPGRITARPIFSKYSVPEIHLAAMDGIAVATRETVGASEQHPVELENAIR